MVEIRLRKPMLANVHCEWQQLSLATRFNLHFEAMGASKTMNVGKRTFLGTAVCVGIAAALPAFAKARPVPLLLVLDIDTPGARKAFEDFRQAVTRRFASTSLRPEVMFAAMKHDETEVNRQALRQILDAAKPGIVLASNSGLARMAGSLGITAPIIFFSAADPVALSLTDSLARPNKGMTGFSLGASADRKRREMLVRLYPACRIMGLLSSKEDIGEGIKVAGDQEHNLLPGVQQVRFNFETLDEFRRGLNSAAAQRVNAWDVAYTNVPFQYPEETVRSFNLLRKPVIYPRMKHVHMGGMAAFEPKIEEADEAWVSQVASLLAGVPIENIPIVQATRYSFGLNLKACRRVGIEPPKSLLRIADLVIE